MQVTCSGEVKDGKGSGAPNSPQALLAEPVCYYALKGCLIKGLFKKKKLVRSHLEYVV